MTAPLARLVPIETAEIEDGAPSPDKVIEGDPRFRSWTTYASEDGRKFTGIWEATPGKWHATYDEWEWCMLTEGQAIVTPDGGQPILLEAGSAIVLEPGFAGTWEVVEKVRKHFVIELP